MAFLGHPCHIRLNCVFTGCETLILKALRSPHAAISDTLKIADWRAALRWHLDEQVVLFARLARNRFVHPRQITNLRGLALRVVRFTFTLSSSTGWISKSDQVARSASLRGTARSPYFAMRFTTFCARRSNSSPEGFGVKAASRKRATMGTVR